MERRKNHSYLSRAAYPSSSKFSSSSSVLKQYSRETQMPKTFNQKLSLRQSSKPSHTNLSPRYKHSNTMTTTKATPFKRPHSGDESWHPFKKQLLEVTGLEEAGVVEEIAAKKPNYSMTKSSWEIYERRRKVAKYSDCIRKKRCMASKVKGDWAHMHTTAQQGMKNLTGALCYRLSLLQVLLHQPKFVHWVQDYHRPEDCVSDDREKCISCCFRLLTLEYWRGVRDSSELSKVLGVMDSLFKSAGWSSDVQSGHADPDEQAAWLFGTMRSEMPTSIFSYFESFFQLVTTSAIHCKRCGHESRTNGHQDRALPVPISPKITNGTLSMYLQKYMAEVVDGYRCEKCKDESQKQRNQLIEHAPDILAVQLKRFRWDGSKDSNAVLIKTTLDLEKYRDANNHGRLQYELTAVIKHSGSAGFGHYICSAKGPDGNWYGFDDQVKSKSSVSEATSVKSRFTPYLLFFQRKEE